MTERQLERCLVSFVVGVVLFLFGYLTYKEVANTEWHTFDTPSGPVSCYGSHDSIRSYNIEQDCVR